MPTSNQVPEIVVKRLPLYLRALASLDAKMVRVVSSQELSEEVEVSAAQIRKDLSYFGEFGKQGKGYDVQALRDQLGRILGLTHEWAVALVGVGNLGHAIATYGGLRDRGFRIVVAFDQDPSKIGQKVGDIPIHDAAELTRVIKRMRVQIGIVAVSADAAQEVVDQLVAAGVRAILNYAPTVVRVRENVRLEDVDPAVLMQSMTYYLAGSE